MYTLYVRDEDGNMKGITSKVTVKKGPVTRIDPVVLFDTENVCEYAKELRERYSNALNGLELVYYYTGDDPPNHTNEKKVNDYYDTFPDLTGDDNAEPRKTRLRTIKTKQDPEGNENTAKSERDVLTCRSCDWQGTTADCETDMDSYYGIDWICPTCKTEGFWGYPTNPPSNAEI